AERKAHESHPPDSDGQANGKANGFKLRAPATADRLDSYVRGAIRKTADRVAAAPQGERHNKLRNESIKLAGLVKAAGDQSYISEYRAALLDAARLNGHAADTPGDAEELIESALQKATEEDVS